MTPTRAFEVSPLRPDQVRANGDNRETARQPGHSPRQDDTWPDTPCYPATNPFYPSGYKRLVREQ